MRRNIVVDPGIKVAAPRDGVEEFVDVYEVRASGIVLHAPADVTRVTVLTSEIYKAPQEATRLGDAWYLDDAGTGATTITLYVGRLVARVDHAVLRHGGFLERTYPAL